MITYPLALQAFWWLLPVASMTLQLPSAAKTNRDRAGELLTAEYGTRLWQGEVEIAGLTADEQRRVTPLIHALLGAGTSFAIDDRTRKGPALDPNGTDLGSAAPEINSLPNARELTLRLLPPGYALSTGDRMSFTYAGRLALHEIVVGSVANASGVTGPIEVIPPLRPGAAAGQKVTLVNPRMRALIEPDSYQPPRRKGGSGLYEGGSFRFRQALRV